MTSPILLDTCAAMFLVADEAMAPPARAAIDAAAAAGEPLAVSPITAWEVGMMVGKGRFRLSQTPERWFQMLTSLPGIRQCALTAEILLHSWSLPGVSIVTRPIASSQPRRGSTATPS